MHSLIQSLTGRQRGSRLAALATPSRCRLAAVSVLAALAPAAPALAQISGDYYFETLPFPEPSYAYDINNDGQAVVYVFSASLVTPATTYLWDHGVVTPIEVPGSTFTQGYGINDKGEVFGRYWLGEPGVDPSLGFRRDSNGNYTSIEFPGAFSTEVQDSNNSGGIVGIYFLASDPFPFPRSYSRDIQGNFEAVVVPLPDALDQFGIPAGVANTTVGINANGEVSGVYFDNSFNFHGFIRDKSGTYTAVAYPNQPAGACTAIDRINNRGSVVGTNWANGCAEESGTFVMSRQGVFEDVPFPPALNGGSLLGINERGDLSGYAFVAGDPLAGQAVIAWRL